MTPFAMNVIRCYEDRDGRGLRAVNEMTDRLWEPLEEMTFSVQFFTVL